MYLYCQGIWVEAQPSLTCLSLNFEGACSTKANHYHLTQAFTFDAICASLNMSEGNNETVIRTQVRP